MELTRRNQQAPLTDNNHLLKTIRGHDGDLILLRIFMGKPFNVMIRRLCLFGIHDMNVMIIKALRRVSLQTVCIKNSNQLPAVNRLIIA